MWKVKLNDGTELENLSLNGNNFISQEEIAESVFEGNLAHVEMTDLETGEVQTLEDGYLASLTQNGTEWWFVLIPKPAEMKLLETLSGATGDITNIELALAEIYEMIV